MENRSIKKELISYVIFGVFTTLVNIISYYFFARVFCWNYLVSNIIAWIISVLFAYITNRIWVFKSKNENIFEEISLFFVGRLFSGIIDTLLMFLCIDILVLSDFYSKVFIQIIVIVLNYVLSKLIVFNN